MDEYPAHEVTAEQVVVEFGNMQTQIPGSLFNSTTQRCFRRETLGPLSRFSLGGEEQQRRVVDT
jgi:hypothetical protein